MPSPPEHLFTPPASQTRSSQKAEEPDLRERILERDRERKLENATARRLELRRAKDARRLELRRAKDRVREQEAVVRGEKSRLDSLASVEQARELWRLQEETRDIKHRDRKRLRDEAGIRAGGAYKKPVASQEATEPSIKRKLVGVEATRSR
jgi:hypothetical protein